MSIRSTVGNEAPPRGEPELIVITRSDAQVRAEGDQVASLTGAPVSEVQDVLRSAGASMEPLFGADVGEAEALVPEAEAPGGGFGTFFLVHAPEERLESLAEELRGLEIVEAAYVKPPAEPADAGVLIDVEPATQEAPSTTSDFQARQGYLNPAPAGIDAPYAWSLPGGKAQNIKIIDCEWGWQFTHEDLQQNNLGLVGGSNHPASLYNNHGTAVFGEIGGDENGLGVTGIASAALLGASSFFGQSEAGAITKAADNLSAGDIILLEIHRPGPNSGGGGQQGYIAVEWWPDDWLAIRYAVNKGIIVVEAAGNGWEDLDSAVYNTPQTGFPAWWKNPFNPSNPSSGAVLVGAGNPPSGTHGHTSSEESGDTQWKESYVDRARCGFSNWGSRVDTQGWGWEVTSTGYGDLQGGSDRNRWYTDGFSGTSSASPIIVGALACTQGVLKAKNMPLMNSERARQLLRSTGSAQQPATNRPVSQRVGNRPNLRQLIPAALRQWIYNATIQYTYAVTSSQAAWAYIKDMGWRRIMTGAPDGVSNIFGMACEAQASGRPVHVYIDDANLYTLWMP